MLYKYLAAGAVGPYSRFCWPQPRNGDPGEWVEVDGELRLTSNGIHACRVGQLPYWIEDELWEIEVTGETAEADRHVLGRRGRLIARVAAWTQDLSEGLARACVDRSRTHAVELLRSAGLQDVANTIGASEGPPGLMTTAWEGATAVPDELAGAILDAGDTGFAVHSGMGTSLAAYLAARSASSIAAATGRPADEAALAERRWQAQWLQTALGLAG